MAAFFILIFFFGYLLSIEVNGVTLWSSEMVGTGVDATCSFGMVGRDVRFF